MLMRAPAGMTSLQRAARAPGDYGRDGGGGDGEAKVEVVTALETGSVWTIHTPATRTSSIATMLGSSRINIKRNRQRQRRSIAAV